MNIRKIGQMISVMAACATTQVFATAYSVPPANESLIGQVQYISASSGDTVVTVAKHYNLGYNSLENANPRVDMNRAFSSGTPLQIPTQHLLPNQARQGIVINLPEMRMYYYLASGKVLTFPIGIGKIGKTIPITLTSITRKANNPSWTPPEDIREFNLAQGVVLPKVMPPGPDNPLGPYAIYMRIPTYLIHSTIFPESVGKRASFGCIRMYESDIQTFFPIVEGGVPVAIVNAPVKVGWQDNRLYVEAHPPLEEHSNNPNASLSGMVHMLSEASKNKPVLVDWQAVSYIAESRDGIPHDVGMRIAN